MPSKDLLSDLNPKQYEAVTYREGPLVIFAGAGTGKTRVITRRIAYLVLEERVKPSSIMAITFTNKAANEMLERVKKLVGEELAREIWISTFHKVCLMILRKHAAKIGFAHNFAIYDDSDQTSIVSNCLDELGFSSTAFKPRAVLNKIMRAKANLVSPEEYLEIYGSENPEFEQVVDAVYKKYQKVLAENNAMDFEDIIGHTVRLLKEDSRVLSLYRSRFKHILVDEYQDINYAQYVFVKLLGSETKNVCVVGDDDQCVTADTEIRTPRYSIPVEGVSSGTEVLSSGGWGSATWAKVEKAMKKPWTDRVIRVVTESGRSIRMTPNHILFAKFDLNANYHYVYLAKRPGVGYRIGSTSSLFEFTEKKKTGWRDGDRIWIVATAKTGVEAEFLANLYSIKYGIPRVQFTAGVGGPPGAATLDQAQIDRIFKEIDTEARAEEFMLDNMIFEEYPHHVHIAKVTDKEKSRVLSVIMFGDRNMQVGAGWHGHRIVVDAKRKMEEKSSSALPVKKHKSESRWSVQTSREDFTEIMEFANTLASIDNLEVVQRVQLTNRSAFQQLPAAHVRPGMIVAVWNGTKIEEERVVHAGPEDYKGYVYDLSIPNLYNYVAGDIVVHNSIYSWRGADIRSLLSFEKDYPGAKVIFLEQNYRSTKNILLAAGEVIKSNLTRREKTLWTQNPHGEKVIVYEAQNEQDEVYFAIKQMRQIIYRENKKYSEFAIFYRTNAQSRIIEEIFMKEGIPYKIVGTVKFYQRKEIKDILAYMKCLSNTADDISLLRILNVPRRGIGEKSIDTMKEFARTHGISIFEALHRVEEMEELPLKSKNTILQFVDLLDSLKASMSKMSVTDFVKEILDKTAYTKELKLINSAQSMDRIRNINELLSVTAEYDRKKKETGNGSVEGFLEEVSLVADIDTLEDENNAVTLMTLHTAKGLEYPVVFIFGMEEGLFPHEHFKEDCFDIEEERRLCYVGMTRAKERLYLVYAAVRRIFGTVSENSPSRFLRELPESIIIKVKAQEAEQAFQMTRPFSQSKVKSSVSGESETGGSPAASQSGQIESSVESYETSFKAGDRVKHSMWGIGTVISATGSGSDMVVRIHFMNVGEKKLLLKYAPIEKI